MESTILEFPFFLWAMIAVLVALVFRVLGHARRMLRFAHTFEYMKVSPITTRALVYCLVALLGLGAAGGGLLTFRGHLQERNQRACRELLDAELAGLGVIAERALHGRSGEFTGDANARPFSGKVLCLMTTEDGAFDLEWSRQISRALAGEEVADRFARFPDVTECNCKYRERIENPWQLVRPTCRYFAVIAPTEIGKQPYSTKVYMVKIPGTIFGKRESMSADGGQVTVYRYRYRGVLVDAVSGSRFTSPSFSDRPFPETLYGDEGPGGGLEALLGWILESLPAPEIQARAAS